MAIYRNVNVSFWTDTKVIDEFSPEDKYFYLYLLTNPHTNLCGCYEISKKQIAMELGYSIDAVIVLLERFENKYHLIKFSKDTNELFILNWSKYNWTKSPKFRKPLQNEIKKIKDKNFLDILMKIEKEDTVSIRYRYRIYTVPIQLLLLLILYIIIILIII